MNLVVVICHFKEDLSWLEKLKHGYVIYNKNPNNNGKHHFDLPNYGFDTIAYLTYIIDHYNNLPDFICFSQDDPFFHCPGFLNKVNDFDGSKKFHPLGVTYQRDVEEILNKTKKYAESVGIEYVEPIKFINSAQCILSSGLVRRKPKSYYERIKNSLNKEQIITETNYLIEYLWPTILGFNNELEISRNNC